MHLVQTDLTILLLAMARFAPLWLVPAVTPFSWVPSSVRMVILLALSLLALGTQRTAPQVDLDSPVRLVTMMVGESVLGLTLSLAFVLPIAALGFSARVVDMQSGLAAANLLNPASHTNESIFGTIVHWGGMIVFFAAGLHVLLLRGMVATLDVIPLGKGGLAIAPDTFMTMVSSQFLLGLMVVVPVILGLFAIDLVVAYASRSMPQANVYFVALPIKVLAGLLLLAATLRAAPVLIDQLFHHTFSSLGWR